MSLCQVLWHPPDFCFAVEKQLYFIEERNVLMDKATTENKTPLC
jgi:hypothetical protein